MLVRACRRAPHKTAPARVARRQYSTVQQSTSNVKIPFTKTIPKPYLGMGTVPYQFTREALLAKKTQEIKQDLEHYNLHKHYFTAAVNSEWFIMPFTKEEYFKVFEVKDGKISYKQWMSANMRILRLAQDTLIQGEISNRWLDDDLEDRAWTLYKKFRFLASESNTVFGYEDRNTDGLTQVRPVPYAGACLLPIKPTRVKFWAIPKKSLPYWDCSRVIDLNLEAPAIDYFRAYVAAFDAIYAKRVPELISLDNMEKQISALPPTVNYAEHITAVNDELTQLRQQQLAEFEAYLDQELQVLTAGLSK